MIREELEKCIRNAAPAFSSGKWENGDKEFWIYGIGNSMDIFQKGLDRLDFEISGYCVDSVFRKQDFYNGKPVSDIEALKEHGNVCILVFSFDVISAHIMLDNAKNMGFEAYFLEAVVISFNKLYVMETFDLLEDEISQRTYKEIIDCRVNERYPDAGTWTSDAYFCWREFADRPIGNVFVDCGCYVGDTSEKYIWHKEGIFEKIYAFEPDERNYKAAQCRFDRLSREWNVNGRIQMECAGVGAESQTLNFMKNHRGLNSMFSEKGDAEKKIYALDDYLTEKVDFIKADIESYEYDMLKGARNSIVKWSPSMAICIYHNAVDLFSIARLIKEYDSRYRFAVRHHSNSLSETVLYAWAGK